MAFRNAQSAPDIPEIGELATLYLRKRAGELRPGGFKSVRYSAGIYDEQKRSIVDQIRLPSRCSG